MIFGTIGNTVLAKSGCECGDLRCRFATTGYDVLIVLEGEEKGKKGKEEGISRE